MFSEYRKLKQLGKVSISLDDTQPQLRRDLHDVNTGEVVSPSRVDIIDTEYLDEKRADLLSRIKDIDELLVDVSTAIAVKAVELQEPGELP